MAEYKCFQCGKKIMYDSLRKRVRCPYCGSKILYKARSTITKIQAR